MSAVKRLMVAHRHAGIQRKGTGQKVGRSKEDQLDHFHSFCIVRAARVSKRTRRLFRGEDCPLPYGRGSDSLYTECENGLAQEGSSHGLLRTI